MPTCNGVSATINVDGRPLPEYQLQVDESTKVATCWIPSHAGKEFTITIHNMTHNTYMKGCVRLDGQWTNMRLIKPGERNLVDKCRPSPTTYRTFVFSPSQLVDDDELPPEALNVANVGAIQLSVDEGHVVKDPHPSHSGDYREIDIPEKRIIPERGKKGLDECVGLGVTRSRPAKQQRMRFDSFQTTGHRAKIVFRYRPLPFLQAQGIAPPHPVRPESPRAPSRKRKRASGLSQPKPGSSRAPKVSALQDGPGEVIDLQISEEEDIEKLRALRARIDKALAKKDPLAAQIKKEVKQEKPPVFPKGEVIDLT